MKINLHIERLILDGLAVDRAQHAALQAAVEAELVHLMAAGDLAPGLAGGGALARVHGDSIQLGREDGPSKIGRQIAGAVYGGIGR